MNIKILKWPGLPWERDLGGMKRARRDEPIRVIIHICMEATQGNSLCRYLYLKLVKRSCFSFYLLSFFFYKIREQKSRTGSAWECVLQCLAPMERGDGGKRGRKINMVQIMYVNAKMTPVECVPGIWGDGIKKSNGGGEFKNDIFDAL
jgi:hypothetical protein